MHTESTYDYAVLRIVPRVDREEFLNAGVILFCLQRRFLGCAVALDTVRLRTLWPSVDITSAERHLHSVERICAGNAAAGPIAVLAQRERFHWLTAPRSALLQTSPVRTGICMAETDLESTLAHLARQLLPDGPRSLT